MDIQTMGLFNIWKKDTDMINTVHHNISWKYAFIMLLIASVIINCSRTKQATEPRNRITSPSDITNFHPEINIKIGWVPYKNQKLVQTGRNEWKIVPHGEDDKEGFVPTMVVSYPESSESIVLDMNIKNELLGKLIKHSAMTMEPIRRPFVEYFEEAKCQNCHPHDVKVDFGYMDEKKHRPRPVLEETKESFSD
ncbi:MAG: hypothetical protein HKN87_19975 [Saprospiraceae bacterium]|nr:hypothetical protein [Saprospiraceae bacterium]